MVRNYDTSEDTMNNEEGNDFDDVENENTLFNISIPHDKYLEFRPMSMFHTNKKINFDCILY